MANTTEDQIKQMYEAQLKSQNEQLTNDYNAAASNLDAQKQQNQQATDANLNRTAVEAQKRALNDEEYYAAAGLTSGARAQAKMARDNQLASDLATIRAAQQAADADAERQRGLLAQEYDSAIRKAQADNDLALAQELYKQAVADEERLRTEQKEAAQLLAKNTGDYSLYGQLYGLTPEQIAKLNGKVAVPEGYLSPEQVEALIAQIRAQYSGNGNGNQSNSVVVKRPAATMQPIVTGAPDQKGINLGSGRANTLLNLTGLRGLR